MEKEELINSIENAKIMHQEQMYKIESALKGKNIKNPTPLGKMNCECGVWFYTNAKLMQEILGMQLFERLDAYHEKWHNEYSKIYNLLFNTKNDGLFSKLIGKHTVSDMDLDKVKLYYLELKVTTQELLKISDSAKRRVAAMPKSKFLSL